MQSLDLLLGKETNLKLIKIKNHTKRQEDKNEINSYSDIIGDAIAYAPISETSSQIYKLDYLDNVMEMRMEM